MYINKIMCVYVCVQKTNCSSSQTHIDATRATMRNHEQQQTNVKIELAANPEAPQNVIHAIENTWFRILGMIRAYTHSFVTVRISKDQSDQVRRWYTMGST